MSDFVTYKSAIGQDEKPGEWFTLHNQLFIDDDGELYFVPRYFITDGFTIPKCLACLGGSKMEWDIRPAVQHDFECKYHKALRVNVPFWTLKQEGLIREIQKDGRAIIICEDIPLKYLDVIDVTFSEANNRFKRALKAVNIKPWRVNMMRFAVNFNIPWLWSKKELDVNKFYKEKI